MPVGKIPVEFSDATGVTDAMEEFSDTVGVTDAIDEFSDSLGVIDAIDEFSDSVGVIDAIEEFSDAVGVIDATDEFNDSEGVIDAMEEFNDSEGVIDAIDELSDAVGVTDAMVEFRDSVGVTDATDEFNETTGVADGISVKLLDGTGGVKERIMKPPSDVVEFADGLGDPEDTAVGSDEVTFADGVMIPLEAVLLTNTTAVESESVTEEPFALMTTVALTTVVFALGDRLKLPIRGPSELEKVGPAVVDAFKLAVGVTLASVEFTAIVPPVPVKIPLV